MKLVQKTFASTAIATTAVLGISMHAEAANLTVNVGLNFTGIALRAREQGTGKREKQTVKGFQYL